MRARADWGVRGRVSVADGPLAYLDLVPPATGAAVSYAAPEATVPDAAAPAAVVLLHGGLSSSRTWARLAGRLGTAGRRVVAPDLRGHGASLRSTDYRLASFAADVVALMAQLNLVRVDLVGHSLGAHVALSVALGQPDRVRRLVLEEPPAPPELTARSSRWVVSAATGGLLGLGLRREADHRAAWSVLRELAHPQPGWWSALDAVEAETLVLAGRRSRSAASAEVATLARRLNARLAVLDAGHRLHSTAFPAYCGEVLPFLLETDRVAG